MDVSIVIRTKNEGAFIEETLRRLVEQDFHGKYEIIIVDSGSTDSTLDIIKRYNVRLLQIPQEEFTYGRSLNIGASTAKGTLVVNLSAHAWPVDEKWLWNLTAGFEDSNVAGVYGRQLAKGEVNPFEALLNEVLFGREQRKVDYMNRRMLKRIHFTNSNGALRKDVWQRYKFNEQAPYGEDLLWQGEVIKAGFSIVYASDAMVYHTHNVSISSVYRNSMNCAYNCALVEQKRQWMPLIMVDIALCLGLIPHSVLQNVVYIWKNKYYGHLKVAPFWVLSALVGSLMGKIRHRIKRPLW